VLGTKELPLQPHRRNPGSTGMPLQQLHGLAAVAVAHAVSAAFCCSTDSAIFLASSTTHRSLCSVVDNLCRRQSSCQRSSVHDSGFTFGAGTFRR
jgi:hypothetical protein